MKQTTMPEEKQKEFNLKFGYDLDQIEELEEVNGIKDWTKEDLISWIEEYKNEALQGRTESTLKLIYELQAKNPKGWRAYKRATDAIIDKYLNDK